MRKNMNKGIIFALKILLPGGNYLCWKDQLNTFQF